MVRTALSTSTDNRTLITFDDTASKGKADAVRIFHSQEKVIAMAIQISKKGLREKGRVKRPRASVPSTIVIDGIPFLKHRQVSFEATGNGSTPVAYRHFSMNLDGQVTLNVVALAEDEDIRNLLSSFDLTPIVSNLPRLPKGFSDGVGFSSTAQLDH